MTFNARPEKRFRKDYKRCEKRGYEIARLDRLMDKLIRNMVLDVTIHKPHKLKGVSPETIECHVTSITDDWLLTYRYDGGDIVFIRTGSHSDLFK